MQVQPTPEQNSFIDLGIQEGRFRDREEAVQQALALWQKRERTRVELLGSLDLAEKSLDADEGETYVSENLDELVKSVKERGFSALEHRHIRAGLAELDAGNGVSNKRVVEWLDSWGTENELPAPK